MHQSCPVCGFQLFATSWVNNLASDEICPCCGTQFGYDDIIRSSGDFLKTKQLYDELRAKWIASGMKWWSQNSLRPKPEKWNPQEQLKNIGVDI